MEQLFYIPESMVWPLAACLVLTGIHVYLGVHVIARKVIFVDLALAQIAALGTVIGVLLGYEVGRDLTALYLYSLAFTIFGAFVFSATRMKGEKVPHEAIIGIVYAVTFAATILVLSKSALGPQELDHIIKGELLWVQGHQVVKTAVIYACVGLFHFIFRKKFMAISFDPEKAEASGLNVRFWDFLFYMSFGFVITSSVAIAGVFLVFSYLVIPSVGAMLISDKLSNRLVLGWIGSAIISFVGVKMSWDTGLPTSPMVVVLFAAALIATGIYRYLRLAPNKMVALRNMAGSAAIVTVFVLSLFYFRKSEEDPMTHTMHMLESKIGTDRQAAIVNLESYADKKADWLAPLVLRLKDEDAQVRKLALALLVKMRDTSAQAEIVALIGDPSDDVRKTAIEAVGSLRLRDAAPILVGSASKEEDTEIRLLLLRTALSFGVIDAIPQILQVESAGGLFADDARDILRRAVKYQFGNRQGAELRRWWEQNRQHLRWDESQQAFVLHP